MIWRWTRAVYISCHPKKVIILSTALAPVRSKKSKQCNCSSSFMVKAASSPNHSFAMTFHPFTILRLLGRKEKIFHELEKKLAERWLAKIDQQSWFRRMLCWQIFTGTLLLVQLRSLHFQGIKNRPVYLRSFAHSWIPSFPTALKASPFLHLHLQVFISAGLNRAPLKRKDFSQK